MKKILSLCLVLIFCLGTVANAQEATSTGFNTIPVEYNSPELTSTFTVVLPDSIELNSDKTQEFDVYLSNFNMVNGEAVRVRPTTSNITMENIPKPIEYLVGNEAFSYRNLPEFPVYYYTSDVSGGYNKSGYFYYKDYILFERNNKLNLMCICKNPWNSSSVYIKYYTDPKTNITRTYIYPSGAGFLYNSQDGVGDGVSTPFENGGYMLYIYDEINNEWNLSKGSTISGYTYTDVYTDQIRIIQSTTTLIDEKSNEGFIQLPAKKDPSNVTITIDNEYLTDGTPSKCTIDGTNLPDGDWNGEVVFEISLVK